MFFANDLNSCFDFGVGEGIERVWRRGRASDLLGDRFESIERHCLVSAVIAGADEAFFSSTVTVS